MGEKTKRLLSILVVICMVVTSVVNMQKVRVSADELINEPVTYEYYDEFGNPVIGTCSDYSVVSNVASDAAIGVASGGAIGVASGGAISIVSGGAISVVSGGAISVVSGGAINSAVIWDGSEQPWYVAEGEITIPERIEIVSGAAVNLILKDGCILTASKGINVPSGSALNIFGQGGDNSTIGQLIATGDTYCAGIGGGYGQSGGTVTINGGVITANGGLWGAGIGGGFLEAGGTIIINSGNINATGGYNGAGIGGGYYGAGGTIIINSGNINANGGNGGAGIGGGNRGTEGDITINGGTVVSTGGTYAAGIGAGDYRGAGGTITLNGGKITATGGDLGGAGVGGGREGRSGHIFINNVQLIATGGFNGGSGIGAGVNGNSLAWLTVNEGIKMYASTDKNVNYVAVTYIPPDRFRYAIVYPEHSGIMSASENTITVTYVDVMGMKRDVNLSISAVQRPLYGMHSVSLDNLETFNAVLGKFGEDAVSESQLKYYNSTGELLTSVPTTTGYYTAKLTVDGVTASLDYYADIKPPIEYEYGGLEGITTETCLDYTIVTNETVNWGETYENQGLPGEYSDNEYWYVVNGNVYINDLVTVNGNVCLVLMNDSVLTAAKGINVTHGNQLCIYRQKTGNGNMGRLCAYGEQYQAGIGGGEGQTPGNVFIYGGNIAAYGGMEAAGIGGGKDGTSIVWNEGTVFERVFTGVMSISGGEVTAVGGSIETSGDPNMPATMVVEEGGNGLGAGYGGAYVPVYIDANMKAFSSSNDWMYSPIENGILTDGRFFIAYPEHSGIMSVSGNTITATCVDMMGSKCIVDLRISAMQGTVYGGSELKLVSLDYLYFFNDILGKSGDDAVSESQLKFYNSAGELLASEPTTAGYYTAKLTVDSVTASLDYYADINPPIRYEVTRSFGNPVHITCSDYTVVSGGAVNWAGNDRWYVVHGEVYINDLVTVTGTVNLILMDGSTLYAEKGINVTRGNNLRFFGQGLGESPLGRLNAYGEYGQAGIGGGEFELSGGISIYGGHISAYGGSGAAGIGGGYNSSGTGIAGGVSIFGGEVTADGGYLDTMGDPTMPATGGYECGAGIGAGINGGHVSVYYNPSLKAYVSGNGWMYSPAGSGNTGNGRSAIVYPENSGVMSVYGDTIYAMYVDQDGYRNSTYLTVKEPSEIYGDDERSKLILENLDSFNTALGKTGTNAVSESKVRYYTRDGVRLPGAPTAEGLYTAKIDVDSVPITVDYDISYTFLTDYYTYWGSYSSQCLVVDGQFDFNDRIWVYGTVNLVLLNGSRINANKGINVDWGSTLNIYSYDNNPDLPTGQLIAHARDYEAAIGGDYYGDGGTIVINGGIIEAYGGYYATGIGGGYGGAGGTMTINGGIVTAVGGEHGAGIGAGRYWGRVGNGYEYGGDITINGGIVNARASKGGAAIGGGRSSSGGTINITGGFVYAHGDGSGIGGGLFGPGGYVNITGGTVIADAAAGNPGIGQNKEKYRETITIANDMKAFYSTDNTTFTRFFYEDGNIGQYVLVYKENSGVMSVDGNTVTAIYVDQNGIKQTVETSIMVPSGVKCGNQDILLPVLVNKDAFNTALGKTGESAVSESQIRYSTQGGMALSDAPLSSGYYNATITIDDVSLSVNYDFVYYPVLVYEYFDNSMNPLLGSCEEFDVVNNSTLILDGGQHEWYIVQGDVYLTERLNVLGSVNLILLDGATLTASKGIRVASGSDLVIYGQGSASVNPGCLYAYGDNGCAGIGGGYNDTAGTITINGGWINANGGNSGAGIGGGSYGNGGNTTINGGSVYATGGTYGAGIGGGDWNGAGGNITINGGTVLATGGQYGGAGIGGGWHGNGGTFTINDGSVTANGGHSGAGIGGGVNGAGGIINVNGGTIVASGGEYGGAGIGAGSDGTSGTLTLAQGMRAFASASENSGYTEIYSGTTSDLKYVTAYEE